MSVSAILLITIGSLFTLGGILEFGCQKAFGCQCVRHPPEEYYGRSDVIFVGKVIQVERDKPFDEANYITFNISKAWKGVDSTNLTVRTGHGADSCSSFPFQQGEEYLVFGKSNLLAIDVSLCGGTIPTENRMYSERDLEYLEANFSSVTLNDKDIDIIRSIQVLGVIAALGVATFVITVKRLK